MYNVLQGTGLELAARTRRRPVRVHPLLPSSCLAAGGNETPDAGPLPAWLRRACRSPYLQFISESLGPRTLPGAEVAANETPDAGLAPARPGICFGPTRKRGAMARNRKRGLGSQPVTPPGRATRPCLQAPPVRRAGITAAAQIGSRLTARRSPDRGNGGPAVSWTSQPGRPATRDFHHPESLTVAVSSVRLRRLSRASLVREGGDSPSVS